MTSSQVVRFPEEAIIRGKDFNRCIDWILGNNGAQRKWVGFDGELVDIQTGASTTGNYADIIGADNDKHLSVRHSSGSADTPADQVFAVDDDFALVGRGKELRLYNTAGSNEASLKHSGTNGHLKSDDSLQVATALNVGASIVATGAGDASIQGALTVTGVATLNGNNQFGNADTDAHTVIGVTTFRNAAASTVQMLVDAGNNRVIVGSGTPLGTATDDKFTVAGGRAYFAGNSGPSIGVRYNASQTVGWLIGVDGAGANKDLLFQDDGAAEILRVGDTSSAAQAKVSGIAHVTTKAFIGATIPTAAFLTTGLAISQGGADDEALALKSSDVAHGMTTFADTDTYGRFLKASATAGGFKLSGMTETSAAVLIEGNATVEDAAAASTSAVGHVVFEAWTKSGTTSAAPGANAHIFVVRSGASARMILDAEGDLYLDATSNPSAYDDHDDVALLEAFRIVTAPGVETNYRQRFSDDIAAHADVLARTGVITVNPDGHHFVSTKALNGLLIDAIRQLAGQQRALMTRLDALEAA